MKTLLGFWLRLSSLFSGAGFMVGDAVGCFVGRSVGLSGSRSFCLLAALRMSAWA